MAAVAVNTGTGLQPFYFDAVLGPGEPLTAAGLLALLPTNMTQLLRNLTQ
jgi:hypothetical protein